ncbi:hypothetical protein Tco_0251639 [Tanacetum coccineum]
MPREATHLGLVRSTRNLGMLVLILMSMMEIVDIGKCGTFNVPMGRGQSERFEEERGGVISGSSSSMNYEALARVMDPNSSLGKICLGENVVEISSDKVEESGDWDSPEYQVTANSGGKKETKATVFHKMDTEEVSDRFVVPCLSMGWKHMMGRLILE